jgi:hypothetical protein
LYIRVSALIQESLGTCGLGAASKIPKIRAFPLFGSFLLMTPSHRIGTLLSEALEFHR